MCVPTHTNGFDSFMVFPFFFYFKKVYFAHQIQQFNIFANVVYSCDGRNVYRIYLYDEKYYDKCIKYREKLFINYYFSHLQNGFPHMKHKKQK